MTTSKNNLKDTKKTKLDDDSVFSKNNGHHIKYRIRQQQEKEAELELKEYEHTFDKNPRVP